MNSARNLTAMEIFGILRNTSLGHSKILHSIPIGRLLVQCVASAKATVSAPQHVTCTNHRLRARKTHAIGSSQHVNEHAFRTRPMSLVHLGAIGTASRACVTKLAKTSILKRHVQWRVVFGMETHAQPSNRQVRERFEGGDDPLTRLLHLQGYASLSARFRGDNFVSWKKPLVSTA